ncbi:MAG TPA: FAD-dependent monooxygenase [Methylophilus sp.]|nr:FAD-dependent monooxygenase [Methylophilus sp.]HQQ32584.1 FAD-dependent monooxygenase [Methylophilus sp.]
MTNNPQSIVIIGAGPVGLTLALSLPSSQPVIILEARPQGASQDGRALALSHGTRLILERLGVWETMQADIVSINTIHISQRGGLGRTVLNATEHGLPSLGYVVSYNVLSKALYAVLPKAPNVRVIYEAEVGNVFPEENTAKVTYIRNQQEVVIETPLAIVADGGRSLGAIAGIEKTQKFYGHDALVTKVSAELPHNHVAYERFTPQGPMALLPNGERDFSLVWTGEKSYIDGILGLDDAEFLRQLHSAFGDRAGRFLSVSKRMSFPLQYATLKHSDAPHVAVIGNAAQTMHPVAGQGFNVGLRDAVNLANEIVRSGHAIGSAQMLAKYRDSRQRDTSRGLLFTDFLVNVFSNDIVGVSALRGFGLSLVDVLKPAKKLLVEKMSFGG